MITPLLSNTVQSIEKDIKAEVLLQTREDLDQMIAMDPGYQWRTYERLNEIMVAYEEARDYIISDGFIIDCELMGIEGFAAKRRWWKLVTEGWVNYTALRPQWEALTPKDTYHHHGVNQQLKLRAKLRDMWKERYPDRKRFTNKRSNSYDFQTA